jgi:hypothetical protein
MQTEPFHVGITGTRNALKTPQRHSLEVTLAWLAFGDEDEVHLHHGVCVGADEEAHKLARAGGGWIIHGHPGHSSRDRSTGWRAESIMADLDVTYPSKPYYARNYDINKASSILVAAPLYPEADPRSARSGTWQTVRDARARGRRIVLVWPDGTTSTEGKARA